MKKHTLNIGLGTAAIGRPQYINVRQETLSEFSLDVFYKQGMRVLDEAYRKGIRYFDTAPGYGMAEQLLIDWMELRAYRDIEIATKWGYTYLANFNPNALVHEVKEHSLAKLNQQWKQSKNLLPDLSSYQIHSATFDSGILDNKEVLDRLGQLKTEYRLHIGLTTSGDNQVEVIKKSLDIERNGEALFDVFQVTYNLLDQSVFQISDLLKAQNKRIIIKEALANGRIFPHPNFPLYTSLYEELQRLAAKYEVGIDAIALRFCMDSIEPYMVLSGASKEKHIIENLKASHFKLEAQELTRLQQFSISPIRYWQERSQMEWN